MLQTRLLFPVTRDGIRVLREIAGYVDETTGQSLITNVQPFDLLSKAERADAERWLYAKANGELLGHAGLGGELLHPALV